MQQRHSRSIPNPSIRPSPPTIKPRTRLQNQQNLLSNHPRKSDRIAFRPLQHKLQPTIHPPLPNHQPPNLQLRPRHRHTSLPTPKAQHPRPPPPPRPPARQINTHLSQLHHEQDVALLPARTQSRTGGVLPRLRETVNDAPQPCYPSGRYQ